MKIILMIALVLPISIWAVDSHPLHTPHIKSIKHFLLNNSVENKSYKHFSKNSKKIIQKDKKNGFMF